MTSFGNWGGVPRYLSAREAAAQLGVSRRTLYVYVSRRLVRSVGAHHQKKYLESDIAGLLSRKRAARRPSAAAHDALDWGFPVLDSAITRIDKGHVWYRGFDVERLANYATIEDTARVLWDCKDMQPFATLDLLPLRKITSSADKNPIARCAELLAAAATTPSAHDPAQLRVEAAQLLRNFYAVAVGVPASRRPLDRVLAEGLGRPRDIDVIRRAIILSADHELSTSAFCARCAASTGAPLAAALLAGLAAFHGPAQGGALDEVEQLIDECGEAGSASAAIERRLRDGAPFPGFGHKLHPQGDCRANCLLEGLTLTPEVRDVAAAMMDAVELRPNNVFALVAMRRSLGLRKGAALTLYACGRVLGWTAHALEQRLSGELIRPRALYTGSVQTAGDRATGGSASHNPS